MGSIIIKIKKLLALSHGNQKEHERLSSLSKAQELMAQYNISLFQLQGLIEHPDSLLVEIKLEPWLRIVLAAVCKVCFTDYYRSQRGNKEFPTFIGTKE